MKASRGRTKKNTKSDEQHIELYKKHRPTELSQVIGQDGVIKMLEKMIEREKIPHAILFTGHSGCGKTTIARVLRHELNCVGSDFFEINCANFNGVEIIRKLQKQISRKPMGGGSSRVWLIDECHRLTPEAQDAFLKMLEDTPSHVYFMLATTMPTKLKDTIRTRTTAINLKALQNDQLKEIINKVAHGEKKRISEEVIDKIIEFSENSARKALVFLNQIADLETEEDQLNAISPAKAKAEAVEVVRTLMRTKLQWRTIANVLETLEEEPEGVRRLALAYANTILLKGGNNAGRAYQIIDAFRENFFECGKAGLAAACWEVVHADGE